MRSRTPTGAEMKQQNSLEVPPQVRSASFDEMQLKPEPHQREGPSTSLPSEHRQSFLKVPYLGPKRSKSFDSGCGDVEEQQQPNTRRRPPSVEKSSSGHHCVHCLYLEEIERREISELSGEIETSMTIETSRGVETSGGSVEANQTRSTSTSFGSFGSSRDSREETEFDEEWEEDDDDSSSEEPHEVICEIKVTPSPNSPSSGSPPIKKHTTQNVVTSPPAPPPPPRNRPVSPKLERQPAITGGVPPSGDLSSQENSLDMSEGVGSPHGSQLYLGSSSEYGDADPPCCVIAPDPGGGSEPSMSRRPSIGTLRATRSADEYRSMSSHERGSGADQPLKNIFLSVPSRRDRAASLDLAYSYSTTEDEMQDAGTSLTRSISLEPPSSLRSKSIEIELSKRKMSYKVVVTSPPSEKV